MQYTICTCMLRCSLKKLGEEGLWKHECLLTIDYDQVYDALPVVVKYDK